MSRLTTLFGCEHPVVFVTGSGAARVGQTVIRTFASHGYRCVVHAHRSRTAALALVEELQASGTKAAWVAGDLADTERLPQLLEEAWSAFGRIDVLVNAAAIWSPQALEHVTADEVLSNFRINTLVPFLTCQAIGLRMTEQQQGGAIINLGDWAVERPYLNYAAYFPSKGAIPTLTRNFAVELAQRNPRVRVNAVLPGPVMLPADLPAEERAAAIAGTLVRREGTPQHVADAVLFLAENDFITGVCLPVDGGRTIASGE